MNRGVLAGLLSLLVTTVPAWSEVAPDFGAMVKDLEVIDKDGDRFAMALWMPAEFWQAALASSGALTEKAINQYTEAFKPFTVIAVIESETGIAGAKTYTDADTLRGKLTLVDTGGSIYQALPADKIPQGITNVIQAMRPILTNSMGPMGTHMELFVFPALGKDGQRIADVRKDGSLSVHLGTRVFHYRLPLGSFLPPMVDRRTGERFPGNYHFNPFTGERLSNSPPSSP